jgi:hypothetical protein
VKKQSLQQLQQKWDLKLAKAGFVDIEDRASGNLKEWHSANQYLSPAHEEDKEYYRLAGSFLHDHKWPSRLYKQIWELHSQGMPIRAIAAKLGRSKGFIERRLTETKEVFLKGVQ